MLDGVNDNTQLMHLHEPSLLFNLRYRYAKDLVYTYTGATAAPRKIARVPEPAQCPHAQATSSSR